MRLTPLAMLFGVCVGAGTVGLVTTGPSLELLFWSVAPIVMALGLWGCICVAVNQIPDFSRIRAEDQRRARRRRAMQEEELQRKRAAGALREFQACAQGRVSMTEIVDGEISIVERGALFENDDAA